MEDAPGNEFLNCLLTINKIKQINSPNARRGARRHGARCTSTSIYRDAAYTNYDVLRVQEVEYIKYKHYILIDISQLYWCKIVFDRFAGRNTTISFTRLISHRIGDYELTGSKLYPSVL